MMQMASEWGEEGPSIPQAGWQRQFLLTLLECGTEFDLAWWR